MGDDGGAKLEDVQRALGALVFDAGVLLAADERSACTAANSAGAAHATVHTVSSPTAPAKAANMYILSSTQYTRKKVGGRSPPSNGTGMLERISDTTDTRSTAPLRLRPHSVYSPARSIAPPRLQHHSPTQSTHTAPFTHCHLSTAPLFLHYMYATSAVCRRLCMSEYMCEHIPHVPATETPLLPALLRSSRLRHRDQLHTRILQ